MPTDSTPKPEKAQEPTVSSPLNPTEGVADVDDIKIAKPATLNGRHILLLFSILAMIIVPVSIVIYYLTAIAVDQYSSKASFSVRSEELHNPLDALSSLGQISSGTTPDADILYEFIHSQKIVRAINEQIQLKEIYSKPEYDPVFAINSDVQIEELVEFWKSMVQLTYEKGSGLIKVETFAFNPKDATRINTLILAESQKLVDSLSLAARKDAIRYAQSDLEEARRRLKESRQKLSEFRVTSKLIDPKITVESYGGITAALQQQLAEALIQRELLLSSISTKDDPRLVRSGKLIEAIRTRIKEERENLTSNVDSSLVHVISGYEALIVDREFAEKSYLAAFAAFDSAKTTAGRRTKYLAVHIEPTFADTALYPRRLLIISVIAALLFLGWAVFMMVFYSFRDRR